jgi:hypothetical protein
MSTIWTDRTNQSVLKRYRDAAGSKRRAVTKSPACKLALQSYALPMAAAATLVMWFHLRSPELAGDFERLMASDRAIVHGSLDTMPDWRLTRPTDVPGQAIDSADYVLIAEIVNIERWQQEADQRVQSLADDLEHLVSSRRMLVLERIL